VSHEERNTLGQVVRKLKGSSQKVRRAQILLKADADGRIAEAFGCRRQTVEMIRQRFKEASESTHREVARRRPRGEDYRHSAWAPPKGYANWTLRLLARKVVELEIVDAVSTE
jgi:hypothetical protein